jgi:hypothetical protein
MVRRRIFRSGHPPRSPFKRRERKNEDKKVDEKVKGRFRERYGSVCSTWLPNCYSCPSLQPVASQTETRISTLS